MEQSRIVQPDVSALLEVTGQPELVTCYHGAIGQVLCLPEDLIENIDRAEILRVRLPRPDNLDWTLLVFGQSNETIEVCQQEVCALVPRKTSGPYYRQHVLIEELPGLIGNGSKQLVL